MVSRLGLGASYGVSARACLKAFDAGVNYFFWGSVRTVRMALAIRQIIRGDRDRLVVVLQCYARGPWSIRRSVERGLHTLGIDYADILLLGWHEEAPAPKVLAAAHALQQAGRCRYLGISSHQRLQFPSFLAAGHYDVFHVRYNAAHRGAEREVFDRLPAEGGPGIATFTSTRWGSLLQAKNMPAGMAAPAASDLYRFSISDPRVHVALCGPQNDAEMDEALRALALGPLDEEALARLRRIGDHVHGIRSLMTRLV
jgi:aryl-alcohol dehydrogenase-like predicted oxidoreductase